MRRVLLLGQARDRCLGIAQTLGQRRALLLREGLGSLADFLSAFPLVVELGLALVEAAKLLVCAGMDPPAHFVGVARQPQQGLVPPRGQIEATRGKLEVEPLHRQRQRVGVAGRTLAIRGADRFRDPARAVAQRQERIVSYARCFGKDGKVAGIAAARLSWHRPARDRDERQGARRIESERFDAEIKRGRAQESRLRPGGPRNRQPLRPGCRRRCRKRDRLVGAHRGFAIGGPGEWWLGGKRARTGAVVACGIFRLPRLLGLALHGGGRPLGVWRGRGGMGRGGRRDRWPRRRPWRERRFGSTGPERGLQVCRLGTDRRQGHPLHRSRRGENRFLGPRPGLVRTG